MDTRTKLMALLPMLPIASAQVVITIGVPICPASSSFLASLSGILPTYSTQTGVFGLPLSTASMLPSPLPSGRTTIDGPPGSQTLVSSSVGSILTLPRSSVAISAVASAATQNGPTPSSSPPSYASGQNFTSPNRVLYAYESNTALSGITVVAASYGSRARQAPSTGGDPFLECVDSCDKTTTCQALSYLGTNCILYGAVSGAMMLVGGRSALNEARFQGFENITTTSSISSTATSSSQILPSISILASYGVFAPDPMSNSQQSGSSIAMPGSSAMSTSSSSAGALNAPTSMTLGGQHSVTTVTDYAQSSSSLGAEFFSSSSSSATSGDGAMSTLEAVDYNSFISSIELESVVSSLSPDFTSSTQQPTSLSISIAASSTITASSSMPAATSVSSSVVLGSSATSAMSSISLQIPTITGSSVTLVTTSVLISTMSATGGTTASFIVSSISSTPVRAPSSSVSSYMVASSTQPSVSGSTSITPSSSSTRNALSSTSSANPFTGSPSSTLGVPAGSSSTFVSSSTSVAAFVVGDTTSASASPSTMVLATATSSRMTSTTSMSSTSSSLTTTSIQKVSSSATSSSTATSAMASSSSSPLPAATPVRNNGKRGLCYTNDTLTTGYSLSGQNSLVSWGYDYYYSRFTGNDTVLNPALTFVPLLFNDNPSLTSVWPANAQQAISQGSDSLLSFNEPDSCYDGSACMTVNQSVNSYMKYMQPFAGHARLGAPAVTNGGPPSSLTWLSQFLGNCTSCTIDFVPLHWYSNVYAFSYLQYYVETAYNLTCQYNPNCIPIWVTEFGIDSSGGTDAQYQAFLQQALPWLDAVPYVERYAYFYDGPGYLINANGSGLSAQGVIYNSYAKPCVNWNNSAGHC